MDKRKNRESVLEPAFQGAKRFEELYVYVDGAARGNPGPAAIGVVVLTREGKRVAAFGEAIGQTTNNYAEYTALVHALRLLSVFEVDRLRLYTDSELMAKQVKGEYRVKEKTLHSLNAQVMSMLRRYRDWEIAHVPREEPFFQLVPEGLVQSFSRKKRGDTPSPPFGDALQFFL